MEGVEVYGGREVTNREAIKMLKTIPGTVYLGNRKFIEAVEKAISALEKQEPMKPMAPELDPLGGVTHPCRNCGGELVSKFHDFCPWCGQAIDYDNPEPYGAEEES